jgi:hypothetical protein
LLTLKVEIREPGRITPCEAQELLAKHRRATLGTALSVASKHAVLGSELLAELRALKDERDWLVHRSMHQDGDSLYTDDGRKTVFSRLRDLKAKTLHIKSQIVAEVEAFCAGHGISPDEADKTARERIAWLRGDA